MRVAMEDRMAEATERGMRAIVLRAGDFMAADGDRGSISCCSRRSAAAADLFPGRSTCA
jgi:hypothetical protein